jgi:hypothetical protein
MLMHIALIILSLYDIFAGVVIISRLYNFFLLVSIFSSLKGIWSIVSDIPFGIFSIMGTVDLIAGITALLLLSGKNIWFYPFVGILILLKGFYCLIPLKK